MHNKRLTQEFYSIKELSEFLGVSRQAIHVAIRKKKLYATKKGKAWTISCVDADFYRHNRFNHELRRMKNGHMLFDQSKNFYSIRQAAKFTGIPIGAIYYGLSKELYPYRRYGSTYILHIESKKEFINIIYPTKLQRRKKK